MPQKVHSLNWFLPTIRATSKSTLDAIQMLTSICVGVCVHVEWQLSLTKCANNRANILYKYTKAWLTSNMYALVYMCIGWKQVLVSSARTVASSARQMLLEYVKYEIFKTSDECEG